jgi:uncharacterized protein (DUF952 family)
MLYHIASRQDWAAAHQSGQPYRVASLETEGFVHCSTRVQLREVANRLFGSEEALLVLVIDPERLDVELRFEDSYGEGVAYPHLYGPVPLDAVVSTFEYCRADDGFSEPPAPRG